MDIFNLPNNDINNSVFYNIGSGDTWQTWTKPRNAKFIYLNVIGGGGGGCFLAGTQITMADGTLKSIENITAGDVILEALSHQ